MNDQTINEDPSLKWYQGITRYQWLVLLIASLGWIFDVFEGQIFVASMNEAMPSLLPEHLEGEELINEKGRWNDIALGFFLFGGALGGVVFGAMSDRVGRARTMVWTILFYSLFTCVTAFAQEPWQMVILRFLVAMGVGGEWAVASAMVAEVMPKRSRPIMSSIFHASSVFGTLLAVLAGYYIVGNPALGENSWRWGFAIGALPALLTVYIRWKLKEPKQWQEMRARANEDATQKPGNIGELFNLTNLRSTTIGLSLAFIGLATFWGVHIYGKNALMTHATVAIEQEYEDMEDKAGLSLEQFQGTEVNEKRVKRAEMISMAVNTVGGGLGLVLFGTISQAIGRKGAFIFYHVGAFITSWAMFQYFMDGTASMAVLLIALPIFGFFTLGMHAGYAVYFPELYPTRLRGTGAGFCFNGGRIVAGLSLLLVSYLKSQGWSVKESAMLLTVLYPVGAVVVLFAKETRNTALED